jgi:hypothetical protein
MIRARFSGRSKAKHLGDAFAVVCVDFAPNALPLREARLTGGQGAGSDGGEEGRAEG